MSKFFLGKIALKILTFFLFLLLTTGVYGEQVIVDSNNPVINYMVWINGGTFMMGSPAGESGRSPNEGPQRRITVSSFYMAMYPVTQAEYQDIMGSNPSHFKGINLPVEQVNWFEAVEYCNRRSLKEGLIPVYTVDRTNVSWNHEANGYRLPTEAEWEYACRAGTLTPFNTELSLSEVGWYAENSERRTWPVGQKLPNSWGLYDMHGNVLEWCWDWLGNYTAGAQTDPLGLASGKSRVYRGGCWRFVTHQNRSAFRFGNHPNLQSFLVGFRVVRSAEKYEFN